MDCLKLLIIEDSEDDYFWIKRKLKKEGIEFSSLRIETPDDLRLQLSESDWDLVISDNSLPGMDANMALEITKKINNEIPFIIVSGSIDEEDAISAMRLGANDYIIKGNLNRLVPAIKKEIKKAESRKKKKAFEQSLLTFVYRSSHDLKGPVSSMKGIVGILKTSNDPKTVENSIESLELSLNSLDKGLQNLINIFKTRESGLKIDNIDIKQFTKNIISDFKYTKGFDNIGFVFLMGKEVRFKSDPFLLKSIIENLIENTIKYQDRARSGIVEIHLNLCANNLVIAIKDNGQGIKEEPKDRVFEMFFRESSGSDDNNLGFYFAKCGIDKLEGQIKTAAVNEKGTIFTVTIPESRLKIEKEESRTFHNNYHEP